jgi:hypothetical protein
MLPPVCSKHRHLHVVVWRLHDETCHPENGEWKALAKKAAELQSTVEKSAPTWSPVFDYSPIVVLEAIENDHKRFTKCHHC